MRVTFWGTRGSLPTPLTAQEVKVKIRRALELARAHHFPDDHAVDAFIEHGLPFDVKGTFGGNTSCVQLDAGSPEYVLCDAGTGLRAFGNMVLEQHRGDPQIYNFFMSHLHWDHIMGFPYFLPAYIKGNLIRIYGCHADLRGGFARQHGPPSFPVPFDALGARLEFIPIEPGVPEVIAGFTVTAGKQQHGGDSYGFRFEHDDKTVVYATDSEHRFESREDERPFLNLFRDADVLIFDAMYSLGEAVSMKEDWGHSSNVIGVELAQRARAKHLVLFHHEPVYDDAMIERVLSDARRYQEITADGTQLEISSAYDGMEINL
ncbi:MAG TPA: MBL fold metallo-hydrolase [Candidatus Lustribacter sp.]|jgi:phosphoribosyl 1,2-cyclic phosphodiesterase|nr:MBL fold metallo-hydrolase [Candidatus Lustribacter sp.]